VYDERDRVYRYEEPLPNDVVDYLVLNKSIFCYC
jgi:hypothetical protein